MTQKVTVEAVVYMILGSKKFQNFQYFSENFPGPKNMYLGHIWCSLLPNKNFMEIFFAELTVMRVFAPLDLYTRH